MGTQGNSVITKKFLMFSYRNEKWTILDWERVLRTAFVYSRDLGMILYKEREGTIHIIITNKPTIYTHRSYHRWTEWEEMKARMTRLHWRQHTSVLSFQREIGSLVVCNNTAGVSLCRASWRNCLEECDCNEEDSRKDNDEILFKRTQ